MPFVTKDAELYLGQVVANGHCVRFCQVACPELPHTSKWRRGAKARGANLEPGTIIATFGPNGYYENDTTRHSHVAVFIAEAADSLQVYDQWIGHAVNVRKIRFRDGQGDAVNDGDRFYVVEV
jgi:hypothetical protein